MSLDGLSFSNSGIYKIPTPIEVAAMAEQSSQVQSEIIIKKTEKSEETKSDFGDNYLDEKTNAEGRETGDDEEDNQNESFEINAVKYKVKFNQSTDLVELIDEITGEIVETITPTDLLSLISKSKGASGILVDRQI